MSLLSPEKLQDALALISKGLTQPTKISKAIGVAYRTYRSWLVRSNRGDPAFLIIVDGEEMQFAKAVTLRTKLALFELRGKLLQESVFGYAEEQTKDGQVVWALDPKACAIEDLDMREMIYGRRDGLLVVDGALVPHTVTKKAPFAQSLALLQAAFQDLRPSSTVTQNVSVNGSVGIGLARPVDYSKGPPAIPPAPPVPMLPAPTDAEFTEVETSDEVDPELDDLIGPEPVAAPINIVLAPEITIVEPVETERVIRDTPTERERIAPPTQRPVGFAEVPLRAPRNELEASLFAELRKAREKAAQS